jgi:hypothetical protein
LVTPDYTLSGSELDALLALPSSDADHFFGADNGFGIPSSDDSFSFDFGFGDQTNIDMDFLADLFTNPGTPPVQSQDAPAPLQEWPLTLPPITASSPPVPTPDAIPSTPAAPIPTRRRRREEVDPKNIVSERRPRKQRVRES